MLLDSHNIARRTFEVARRGYEQQEVRGYLHEVSALVDRLQREARQLRERAERAEARLGLADGPDEAMLLEILGEETTRVLTSAREAAGRDPHQGRGGRRADRRRRHARGLRDAGRGDPGRRAPPGRGRRRARRAPRRGARRARPAQRRGAGGGGA